MSSSCSSDPVKSWRLFRLLWFCAQSGDIVSASSLPIMWKLDVFYAFSTRFTIGDLVRRSSPCACHPVGNLDVSCTFSISVDSLVISYLIVIFWASDCWSEASLHFDLSITAWTTSSRHQIITGHTLQLLPPYTLHPSHEHEVHQCSMSNTCCWGRYARRDDRTCTKSEHDSDQNNCRV